ncbi:unnamed protein product [Clonostachys solani]|uniref:MalT-like TPR region domain-containing protein n=1 Tax=Clonostachys solani TaxID=160281 RepID=A0A9N9YZ20_9HYPO|nr:unnamed protein product [Clonostachys solani]
MTLLEASRLPKLSWKRFAIDEAAFLSKEFANWEVDCRIAQSRAVVARITGQIDSAFACLDATIGDTLRELDNPQLAETYLQSEIARRTGNGITAGVALLELSLAEALFAQGRLKAAEVICKNIQDRPTLLKFERLRLHLLSGRLYFETNDLDSLTHWSAALRETGSFHLTNGRTTRVIVLSICDILRRLGHADLVQQSMQQVAFLEEAADPMAINYWIARMRHLQSSRSKI